MSGGFLLLFSLVLAGIVLATAGLVQGSVLVLVAGGLMAVYGLNRINTMWRREKR